MENKNLHNWGISRLDKHQPISEGSYMLSIFCLLLELIYSVKINQLFTSTFLNLVCMISQQLPVEFKQIFSRTFDVKSTCAYPKHVIDTFCLSYSTLINFY